MSRCRGDGDEVVASACVLVWNLQGADCFSVQSALLVQKAGSRTRRRKFPLPTTSTSALSSPHLHYKCSADHSVLCSFIVFRASDVKDLQIEAPGAAEEATPSDPAIVGVRPPLPSLLSIRQTDRSIHRPPPPLLLP